MNQESNPIGNRPAETTPTQPTPKKRPAWLPIVVLLAAFLVGFLPMWLKSSRLKGNLAHAESQLRLDQLHLTFADAALDARRGEYEPARQEMASFFSLVTVEQNRGLGSALPAGSADELQPLLAKRDDLITLLARGDPASAGRLADAYAGFRKLLGN